MGAFTRSKCEFRQGAWVLAGALGLAALAVASCYSDAKGGVAALDADWSFEGDPDCLAPGVDIVAVSLANAYGAEFFAVEAACADGGVKITDLRPGPVTLRLRGLTANDELLYEHSVELELRPGVNDLGTVDLEPVFARVTATLRFGEDGEGTCAAAGADAVETVLRVVSSKGTGRELVRALKVCENTWAVDYVPPGRYEVAITGMRAGQRAYEYVAVHQLRTGVNDLGELTLMSAGAL